MPLPQSKSPGMSLDNTRNVLRSWFTAIGESPEDIPAGLMVRGTPIQIAREEDDITVDGVYARHRAVASPNVAEAVPAFCSLARAVGAPDRVPVDRGAVPSAGGRGDPFLAIVRHTEFRHAPDLAPGRLASWMDVIGQTCSACWWRYRPIMQAHGIEIDDLKYTYAIPWAHIFAHKGDPGDMGRSGDGTDAPKMLRSYLRQRFVYLIDRLVKTAAANVPDPRHGILLHSEEGEYLDEYAGIENFDPDDPEASEVGPMPRNAARRLLQERLASMPHDAMISALEIQRTSQDRDQETRDTARRFLVAHQRDCATCCAKQEGRSAQP